MSIILNCFQRLLISLQQRLKFESVVLDIGFEYGAFSHEIHIAFVASKKQSTRVGLSIDLDLRLMEDLAMTIMVLDERPVPRQGVNPLMLPDWQYELDALINLCRPLVIDFVFEVGT